MKNLVKIMRVASILFMILLAIFLGSCGSGGGSGGGDDDEDNGGSPNEDSATESAFDHSADEIKDDGIYSARIALASEEEREVAILENLIALSRSAKSFLREPLVLPQIPRDGNAWLYRCPRNCRGDKTATTASTSIT